MILNKMYVLGATQWKSIGVEKLSYKYNLSLSVSKKKLVTIGSVVSKSISSIQTYINFIYIHKYS